MRTADADEEIREANAKAAGNAAQRAQLHVIDAPLDTGNVGPVEIRSFRKLFLREL